jgi:hypothetical protein
MTTRLVEGSYEVQMLFPSAAAAVVKPQSARNKPLPTIRRTRTRASGRRSGT